MREKARWWIDFLDARRDPEARWTWDPPQGIDGAGVDAWGLAHRLALSSSTTVLECLLVEPIRASGTDPIVVLPFYDVESLLGLPSPRTPHLSPDERRARAYGRQLVEFGLAVLLVPWWCEADAVAAGEQRLGLDDRYTAPALRHRERQRGTAFGRAVGDLLSTVDALTERCPGRRIGAFGHSLGGKLVLALAAIDHRIHAAVIHEPGLGWQFSNWDAPWYLGAAPPREPDLDELLALIAPRPCLYVGGGGYDGAANEHLARAAQRASPTEWLRIRRHDAGHTPPASVLRDCHNWLRTRLRSSPSRR